MAALLALLQKLWQEQQISLTLFNSLTMFLLFFFSILFLKKFTRGTKLNLPPSPPKLPIIGNLHQLGTLPHRSLRALSKKYGPIMLMHLGHAPPTLIITSAEIAKEMIKTHDIVFSNRPRSTAADIFLGCSDVVFSPYGEYWRQARKICVNELLSIKRVQSFKFVRDEEVAVLIERIRCCSSCPSNGAGAGAAVNLTEMLFDVSNKITSRCVIGQKCEEEDGKNKFRELMRKLLVQFVSFSVGDFFPCLGWLDVLTGLISRLKKTFTEFDSFYDQVIEEHKMILKSKDRSDHKDFVDVLLQLQRDDLLNFDLTPDKLKALITDMFLAGTDTTSKTLEWTMAELIRNPTALNKAQEEVRRLVGKKEKVDESVINQLSYLKCVIKESLRLHPPLSLLVPRETSAGVKLGGYDISPKTRVLINAWAIQRDPELWGDRAEEFIPERFENNPVHDFQYIPFGIGRRGCPGMSFGVATVEYVISSLLYWFDWALPDDANPESLDMTEIFGPAVHKKLPLHVVPVMHYP